MDGCVPDYDIHQAERQTAALWYALATLVDLSAYRVVGRLTIESDVYERRWIWAGADSMGEPHFYAEHDCDSIDSARGLLAGEGAPDSVQACEDVKIDIYNALRGVEGLSVYVWPGATPHSELQRVGLDEFWDLPDRVVIDISWTDEDGEYRTATFSLAFECGSAGVCLSDGDLGRIVATVKEGSGEHP